MWKELVDTLKSLDFLTENTSERRLFWSIVGGLGGLVLLIVAGFGFTQWWHFKWWQDVIVYVALLLIVAAAIYLIATTLRDRRAETPPVRDHRLIVLTLTASLCLVAVMLTGSVFGDPITVPVLTWWLALTLVCYGAYLARRQTKLRSKDSNQDEEAIDMTDSSQPTDNAPAPYSDTHHPKYFVKRLPVVVAVEVVLGAAVIALWLLPSQQDISSPWYAIGRVAATAAIVAAMIVCGYRPYWRWKSWRYALSPTDGQLRIYEPGHRLLVIRGSSPDTISIDEVEIDTPEQSILEQYLFKRSHTLILKRGDQVVFMRRDIRDVDQIRLIKQYRSSLTRRSTETLDDLLEVSSENNRLLRSLIAIGQETNRLLAMAIEPYEASAAQPSPVPAESVDSPD